MQIFRGGEGGPKIVHAHLISQHHFKDYPKSLKLHSTPSKIIVFNAPTLEANNFFVKQIFTKSNKKT